MATKIRTTPRQGAERRSQRSLCTLSLAALSAGLISGSCQALEFNLGEVEGRLDSSLSIGASWRTDARDPALVSALNGGTAPGNGVNDDGTLNFEDEETFSKIFKGVHDLSLTYDNLGAFVRGKYWYDFELEDEARRWGHGSNRYAAGQPLNDDGFNDYAQFSGAELLDAFVYGDFELGEMPATVRLGRQVVNWGESAFIQGGVNAINPIDVAAFRRPGAEIKEGLLPVNMAYANLGVTDALSLEGFYQLQWEETAIDGCGTYFSTVDYIAQGCDVLTLGAVAATNGLPQFASDRAATAAGFFVERGGDRHRFADDDGQFGLALRYFAEALNDTEFGFYYLNYHSRLPVASGITTGYNWLIGDVTGDGAPDTTPQTFIPGSSPFSALGQNPVYFTEYPEDIRLLGLSFSTSLGEFAVSGEVSHQRDLPLQINGADLVGAILFAGAQPGNPMNGRVSQAVASTLANRSASGTEVRGYDLFDVSQAQMTVSRFFDRVLGASRLVLVGELAVNHIHSFQDADAGGIRYGRASQFGQSGSDGFTTQDSWGYRLRTILSYPDAVAGINLLPGIAWSHDVEGYAPVNTGFVEGRRALNFSLDAEYLNTYEAGLSYTRYSGGDYDVLRDRDFISLSFGVNF